MRSWRSLVGPMISLALIVGCGGGLTSIEAVNVFPTVEELAALREPEAPPVDSLPISASEDVAIASPPAFGAGNAAARDGSLALAVRSSGASRVTSTAGMACAADALSRFYLREQARPTGPVLAFILGRCGVTAVDPRLTVRSRDIDAPLDDESIDAGHVALFSEIRPTLEGRPIPFEVEIGSGFAAGPNSAVWLAITAQRQATLSATRLDSGRFLLAGRLASERVRAIEGWVNRGAYGVSRCEPDPEVQLPDVRFTCAIHPNDATAHVDLVAIPRQRLLSRRVATVLLHRDDEASLAYRPPPELAPHGGRGDAVAQLVAAVRAARADAGQDSGGPLPLSDAESRRHAALLGPLLAARRADNTELVERLTLGLLAGWDTDESLAFAEIYLGEGDARDARGFVRDQLTTPYARRVLLSPEADLFAAAARETDDGFRGALTFFRVWDETDVEQYRRAWTARINEERLQGGVSPLVMQDDLGGLGEVRDLQQEADKVTRGEAHPEEALDDAMARLRGRLGRTVRGWYVSASNPRWVALPAEFQDSGDVSAVTGVAWHHSEGAAWGQLVLFLCVFPE